MKHYVVTGTSTGIGYATAKYLTDKGHKVFGSVRKAEDGERVKSELGKRFIPLVFDVVDRASIDAAVSKVQMELGENGLAGLVNNAGIAVSGPLLEVDADDLRFQFEVNVVGLIQVTQAFARLLGAYKNCPYPPGKIINISSVAGKVAPPFMGPYVASKHAVEGISHSLRRELMLYGIDVVIVAPGAVKTPIWDKESSVDLSKYEGSDYQESGTRFQKFFVKTGKEGLEPEKLGELIYSIFLNKNPKTRYVISPAIWKEYRIPRMMSDRRFDKMLKKNLRM